MHGSMNIKFRNHRCNGDITKISHSQRCNQETAEKEIACIITDTTPLISLCTVLLHV